MHSAVEKYFSCGFHCSVSADEEEVVKALLDQGINVNYCCENRTIVTRRRFPISCGVAILHGSGKVDDQTVIDALTKSCGNCDNYFK